MFKHPSNKIKVGAFELCGPDYRQVHRWAEDLDRTPEDVLNVLSQSRLSPDEYSFDNKTNRLRIENGVIKELVLEDDRIPIGGFVWEAGLGLEELTIIGHMPTWVASEKLASLRVLHLLLVDLREREFDLSPVPDLAQLDCTWCTLPELDLTPVPRLTVLRSFECNAQENGEGGLTRLDLSPVPRLTTLWWEGGDLTALDLSRVPRLKKLRCNRNQLTELDLSPVQDLVKLNCDMNQLTKLDLSFVPRLTELSCSSNHLTVLDLSSVPKIMSLWCVDNRLVELDLRLLDKPSYCLDKLTTIFEAPPRNDLSVEVVCDKVVNVIHKRKALEDVGLPADWIYRNHRELPWGALIGATIHTKDGHVLSVTNVVQRPWPHGPLLRTHWASDPTRPFGVFNIRGFASGTLQTTYPSEDGLSVIRSFYERIENEQAEREEARKLDAAAEERVSAVPVLSVQDGEKLDTAGTSSVPNAVPQFDLLLFDLDDTLVLSGHLDSFRGQTNLHNQSSEYISALRLEATALIALIPQDFLVRVRVSSPDLRLGVFTRAPATYARILLEACFPKVMWSCVVDFEGVKGRTKPHPDGIYLAARQAGVSDLSRVAMIGDDRNDILAAYQAGAFAILYTKAWGSQWAARGQPKRSERYWALELMADALVGEPHTLHNALCKPKHFLPAIEAWDAQLEGSGGGPAARVDTRKHFNNLPDAGAPNWVEVHALGRYFAHSGNRYDFHWRECQHGMSAAILAAKDGKPYPDEWADCVAHYISRFARNSLAPEGQLVICTIPSSSSFAVNPGANRLNEFVGRVHDRLPKGVSVLVDPNTLTYTEGVLANKTLNQADRFLNVRDHLVVANKALVQARGVIVLDDVVTSGATFFYACRYLMDAGARRVHCLALAQTIS